MPRAIWGTPQPASVTGLGYEPEDEPRGLLDFISGGSGNDVGAELSDRMGVIAQILMAAGSGRGGAGIAEATAAANERSQARREDSRNKAMVHRMADKLEPSNPEMAMMMRSNTKFGLAMLGRQLESQWDSENDLTKLKKQYEYEGANQRSLAQQKTDADRETARLRMKALGYDLGGGSSTAAVTPQVATDTSGAVVPPDAVPPPIGGTGTGGGPAPAPIVPDQPPPPAPPPTGGTDYTVGLTTNPQLREVQLKQRIIHDDPDMPIEDALQLIDSAFTDTSEGANTVRKNVAERKARRARVQGIQTRGQAADAVFQEGQGLPGINLNAPGEMEMRGAGIDPKLRPDLNPAQTAERMRVAAEAGDTQYNSLLNNLAQPPAEGAVRINPETGRMEVTGGAKDTEGDKKAAAYYLRGKASMVALLEPAKIAALTNPALGVAASVPLVGNLLTSGSPDYQIADTAAKNFLISILRPDTGATINPDEEALYRSLFIPQAGDDPLRVEYKAGLREQALEGVRLNQSKEKIAATAADAWKTFKPQEQGPAPEMDPAISSLLKKYPPKPAAGP